MGEEDVTVEAGMGENGGLMVVAGMPDVDVEVEMGEEDVTVGEDDITMGDVIELEEGGGMDGSYIILSVRNLFLDDSK